jgi:hypothetical protein
LHPLSQSNARRNAPLARRSAGLSERAGGQAGARARAREEERGREKMAGGWRAAGSSGDDGYAKGRTSLSTILHAAV